MQPQKTIANNALPEVETSWTHFEVKGLQVLGLETSKSSKCPVLGARTALFFDIKFVKKEINQTKINLNFGLPAR